ncbi:hypothetical protein F5Y15DRAFT_401424 [Xylariaceae sp. FL0016]|nr:hypothetical protein F5Y15DRAFT_401424 [Xylariaceae sp. FL0016]
MTPLKQDVFINSPLPGEEGNTRPGRRQQEVTGVTLTDLPPELHLLISRQLIYPDALSLKHTSRHFYSLVDTGVRLKVAWLMERRSLHLDCPRDCCDLRSDLRFFRGSVKLLMQRRREHLECESRPGLGCIVLGTRSCAHKRTRTHWCRIWFRSLITLDSWWLLLAMIPILLGCLWVPELASWRFRRAY